jgi:hypothetical protein
MQYMRTERTLAFEEVIHISMSRWADGQSPKKAGCKNGQPSLESSKKLPADLFWRKHRGSHSRPWTERPFALRRDFTPQVLRVEWVFGVRAVDSRFCLKID